MMHCTFVLRLNLIAEVRHGVFHALPSGANTEMALVYMDTKVTKLSSVLGHWNCSLVQTGCF